MTQTTGRMIQPVRRPSVPVKSILVRRDLASTTRRCAARIRLHSAILIPTPQSSSSISFARSRESSARLSRCRALASSISINSIVPHPLQSLRLVNRLWPPLVPAVRERAAQASLWLAEFWNATGGAGGWKGTSNEISQCPKQASGFGRSGCSGGMHQREHGARRVLERLPGIRPGEFVVVDTGDRTVRHLETYLIHWHGGRRTVCEAVDREFNWCDESIPPSGWSVRSIRGLRGRGRYRSGLIVPSPPVDCWIYPVGQKGLTAATTAILKARSSMRRHSKARSARRRWVHHEDCKNRTGSSLARI